MSSPLEIITGNAKDFLKFTKTRYKLIHLSNVFFRDLHYAVMGYLELNKVTLGYPASEEVTRQAITQFEQQGVLRPIDARTWMLNSPEFKLPVTKPAATAKPAPGAAARPAPAAKPATPPAIDAAPQPAASPTANQNPGT